ncbi:HAD-IIIA family hydrolase [Anaerocolumna sedimenticola]|uniref:HAD-IIIA family hydrolase n=1 Tax=Anaerocolumna sedimenticola TaxID=2696063 RepID=A0A6P1TQY3_9FIRM|nr:HAD family hydrolase [Anaerocolumna sedimenticola]QHQ62166.1 HAD-IIIA family hydrolase [Anaerocolumna sedimenticola]
MKYTTVIFDLDGTLLNTLEDLTDSVNYALGKFGYPLRTIDEIRQFVGNGVKVLINLAVPNKTSAEDTDKCLKLYRKHYSENMQNKTRPYDGITEMLKSLKEKGIKLAVVSNKYDTAVKALCNDYYKEYIEVAIGESPDVAKKPAPDSVFAALKELGSEKEDALYVGDSDVDVHTAHNAGIKCVGVTWGFRNREILKREGADYIIDKPEELLQYVK